MADFAPELKRMLVEGGAQYLRPAKGSHELWQGANGRCFTVPHRIKSRNTANEILKQAGLEKAF